MAEVLARYDHVLAGPDGREYRAQASGGPASDRTNRWEGWIEFLPLDGGDPIRSRRETTQPNQTDAAYWASGLSAVYLQGCLDRTLTEPPAVLRPAPTPAIFDAPAPANTLPLEPARPTVLNPFSVYRKSEAMLRTQLNALSGWHLANIVQAYELSSLPSADLERMTPPELVDLIVANVREGAS